MFGKKKDQSSVCCFWEIPVGRRDTEIRASEAGNEPLIVCAVVNHELALPGTTLLLLRSICFRNTLPPVVRS